MYDYIIVGTGSSGCSVANWLSADPAIRILLIEAGPSDRNWLIHMPRGNARLMSDPRHIWYYGAKPAAGRNEPEPWVGGKTNRGSLPSHLERIEQVVDLEDRACPCCGGLLHQIGEDVAERLDVVPTTFRVLVTRRPRYGCRSCESAIVQAPAPARIIVDNLHQYPSARNRQVNAKSKLGEAIRYALTRWDGLSRFLDNGRIDLDSNTVERSIRPLALNRKNALFVGSDEGGDNWAVIATLIENCKISGINPHTWLTETLGKLAAGHPASAVGELIPWTAVA